MSLFIKDIRFWVVVRTAKPMHFLRVTTINISRGTKTSVKHLTGIFNYNSNCDQFTFVHLYLKKLKVLCLHHSIRFSLLKKIFSVIL